MTKRTAAEIKHFGVTAPTALRVTDSAPEDAAVIATFFLLDEGKILPDNVLGKCTDCQCVVQLRPHVAASTLLCLFCGADRAIAEAGT